MGCEELPSKKVRVNVQLWTAAANTMQAPQTVHYSELAGRGALTFG